MRIGTIGAGNMARALGRHWITAGHDLMLGSRTPDRAAEAAAAIGATCVSGSLSEAAHFGDAVLIAVRQTGVLTALESVGAREGSLRDRVLIDCTNPIDEADSFRLVTADGPSMASAIAQACPGAHVAKAFNLGSAGLWQMTPPRTADGPIVVPIAANSDHALRVTSELVEAVGCVPFPWGPLDRADQIEAVAAFGIRLIVEGLTFDSVMPTTQPGPPPGT